MSAATSEALSDLGAAIAYGITTAIVGGCELPLTMTIVGANGVRARYRITDAGDCLLLETNMDDEGGISMPFDFTFIGANEFLICSRLEPVERPAPN